MATAREIPERISLDPELVREERELSKFFYERSIVNAEERGKAAGKLEGERQLFLRLLRAKFGELSESREGRVRAATEPELVTWSVRVLTASSLDELFDG